MRHAPPVAAITPIAVIRKGYVRALRLDIWTSGVVNGAANVAPFVQMRQ